MRRLILLRHAKSDYPPGVPDHDRPLNERGRRNAATIANRLSTYVRMGERVHAVVSTAVRAEQTWSVVVHGSGFGHDMDISQRSDRSLYLAEPATLLEVAAIIDADVGIIVGHNPGLEELARSAESASELQDRESGIRLLEKFPTSSFVVLECSSETWRASDIRCTGFVICR